MRAGAAVAIPGVAGAAGLVMERPCPEVVARNTANREVAVGLAEVILGANFQPSLLSARKNFLRCADGNEL